ncbi:MAG TPA: hypothetical protein VGM82_17260 [Gemmatimonadaceae bacterium]|jgi:hypothetical protein
MRRSLPLLLLLAACATGGNTVQGSDSAPQRQAIFQSEQGMLMTDPARAEATEIDAPPAAVWAAVKKVYMELEIPVTVDNLPGHQLGNANFYKTRRLGGEAMQSLVSCGNGITGPNAASFRINMSLLTDVNPNGKGGTKLQTTLIAKGQDVTGGSTDLIPCAPTGRLESMLLGKVKMELGKS